ncbi:MAG: nitrogen regulation protein NR(II) [Woeseiaceae bacterium]
MLEQLTTGVVLLNTARTVDTFNSAAEHLFQVSRKHIAGKSLRNFFNDPALFDELVLRCQSSGETFAEELELQRTNGLGVCVLVDCRISSPGNQTDGPTVLELADVTSRRRINRDQHLKSQRDTGRKISRQLAHEIKNPLGGLRGAAQLLQRQIDDQQLTAYTDVIIREADRLAALVDSLLGPGGMLQKVDVNIHDVLEHVLQLVAADVGDAIQWHRDYDPSLPLLHLDRNQMIQAVLNLVRNAVSAANSARAVGQVTLRTRALTNDNIGGIPYRLLASIEIIDDGPGIHPDIRDSVFYPLVTGKSDGTGIGLTLSQELINRHDGLIEFTSEPGETVFQIRLPVDRD